MEDLAPGESRRRVPSRGRAGVELPANREEIELHTTDGLRLVGELATPIGRPPVATLVTLHPLPTAGGFMDSHILRKAAARLPALADLAVLRFNTRGTTSPRGRSEGSFGEGVAERADVAAAMAFVAERGVAEPVARGLVVRHRAGLEHGIAGAVLLSPPLHRTSEEELSQWNASSAPIVAVIPEHDDYLKPAEAAERFAVLPRLRRVDVEAAGTCGWGSRRRGACSRRSSPP